MHATEFPESLEDIEGALADSPQSVVEEQVTDGVAVRMAVLEHVCSGMD